MDWGGGWGQVRKDTLRTGVDGARDSEYVKLLYVLTLDFHVGKSISRITGRGDPENLDFFGPKWIEFD
jgi:hypothetical protein